MTSHSRCAKDSASCDTKFCLLREHRVLADVLLKNFVAAAVFSVSYFLSVVEEFRSCSSKPERSACHFGLPIGRAVMYRDYVIKACDTCDMTCEHVSRQGELWPFFPCALDLSVSVGFYTASFTTDFKQHLTG